MDEQWRSISVRKMKTARKNMFHNAKVTDPRASPFSCQSERLHFELVPLKKRAFLLTISRLTGLLVPISQKYSANSKVYLRLHGLPVTFRPFAKNNKVDVLHMRDAPPSLLLNTWKVCSFNIVACTSHSIFEEKKNTERK